METRVKISVLDAIKSLSAVCDGAATSDGSGFNKPDSYLKSWAIYPALTSEQQAEAITRLQKYKNQLGVSEIFCEVGDDADIAKVQTKASILSTPRSFEKVNDQTGKITFSYNPTLVNEVKKISGRRYDGSGGWIVPLNSPELPNFLKDYEFIFDPAIFQSTSKPKNSNRVEMERGKFQVYFQYNPEMVAEIKTFGSRKFNPDLKCWEVPCVDFQDVMQLAEFAKKHSLEVSEDVGTEFEKAVTRFAEYLSKMNQNTGLSRAKQSDFVVREGIRGTLRPFQVAGVEYGVLNRKSFFADDMGLGKTLQSIATAWHLDAFPVLVICPNTLKFNWAKEWLQWLGIESKVIESSDTSFIKSQVYICNYNAATKHQKELVKLGLKTLIVDESQAVKEKKSQRSKAVNFIAKNSNLELTLLLTGTAIVNRPKEIINQLDILGKLDQFGGFWNFAKRYCNMQRTRFGMDISGAKNLPELHEKLRQNCYIRREKSEVLAELPAKTRQIIEVETDNRKEYRKAENDLIDYLKNELSESKDFLKSIKHLSEKEQKEAKVLWRNEKVNNAKQAEHLVRINLLKQLAAKGKTGAAIEFISDIAENEKVVVFAVHKEVVSSIADHFGCKKIDGTVKPEDRQKAVEDFQNNPDTKVIVLNIAAGNVGLTLTAASKLVFIEQGWTPGEHDQAEDRIHRIGQTNAANIYYLIAKNTIDVDIYNLIDQKRQVTDAVNKGLSVEGNVSIMNELINNLIKK